MDVAFITEGQGVQMTTTFAAKQKLSKQKLRSLPVRSVLECLCSSDPSGKFDTD